MVKLQEENDLKLRIEDFYMNINNKKQFTEKDMQV